MLQKLNDLIEDLGKEYTITAYPMQAALLDLATILKEYIERNVFVPLCTKPLTQDEGLKKLFVLVTNQINWHEGRLKAKNIEAIEESTKGVLRGYRYTLRMIEKLQKG